MPLQNLAVVDCLDTCRMNVMKVEMNKDARRTKSMAFCIFLLFSGGLLFLEWVLRRNAIAGIYFHGIPSESMMQTVSIIDLRDQPFQSLWYLHIQPPLFDFLRAILVATSDVVDPLAIQYWVDRGIYFIWAIAYGLICALIFIWVSKLTNLWWALISTCFFAAGPAPLLYATLLETTILSSLLILIFIFLLWKINRGIVISPWLLSSSFLALFFTRSVFQWPWVFVSLMCLVILKYPIDLMKKFFIITGLVVALFLCKQFFLFGITSTSSFSGLNLCQSIGACRDHYISEQATESNFYVPNVLQRDQKLTGAHNFNNLMDLELNKLYLEDYKQSLRSLSLADLINQYQKNLNIYFQPSSNYANTNLLLVKMSPRWKNYYEKFFSAPVMPIFLIVSALFWLVRHRQEDIFKSLGVVIPVLMIFSISILFESGENMRFKFFIEPVLFIFIASQMYLVGMQLLSFIKRQNKQN